MYMKKLMDTVITVVKDYLLKITVGPEIAVRGKLITATQNQRVAQIILGIWFLHVLLAIETKVQEEAQATKEISNPKHLVVG